MHHRRRSRRRDKRQLAPCGCCEVYGPDVQGPQIEENEICNGKAKKAKPKPKKDKCPVNRVHEWYKEVVVETVSYRWYNLPDREVTYDVKTCIHCWKQIKKIRYPYYVKSWRKLKLPKRPVKDIYEEG